MNAIGLILTSVRFLIVEWTPLGHPLLGKCTIGVLTTPSFAVLIRVIMSGVWAVLAATCNNNDLVARTVAYSSFCVLLV